jgi:hypothetical protein
MGKSSIWGPLVERTPKGRSSYQSVNGPQDQIINNSGVVGFSADTGSADPSFLLCGQEIESQSAYRTTFGKVPDLPSRERSELHSSAETLGVSGREQVSTRRL